MSLVTEILLNLSLSLRTRRKDTETSSAASCKGTAPARQGWKGTAALAPCLWKLESTKQREKKHSAKMH